MGYCISDNYSVLNNYNYENKSSLISALDWLSTPCRRSLGGRNVDVISQTYEVQMSTASRVMTIFLSVLIFPVAIVSIAGLLIKLATFPFIWEKKIVQVESQKTWDAINHFNTSFEKGEYDEAIKCYKQNPHLADRSDINDTLFKVINKKINKSDDWQDIESVLPLISKNDAIELINHAVKVRLEGEIKNDVYDIDADDIMQFVNNSLSYPKLEVLESCIQKIIGGALQLDVKQDILLTTFKMELADRLINSLTKMQNDSPNQYASLHADVSNSYLRTKLFKNNQDHTSLYLILHNPQSMQKVCSVVQNVRTVSKMGTQALNKVTALTAQNNPHPQSLWNDFRSELKKYLGNIKSLISVNGVKDKQYVQNTEDMVQSMIKFIDNAWNVSSAEKMVALIAEMDACITEKAKSNQVLISENPISLFSSNLEAIVEGLGTKMKGELFVFTQKLRGSLNHVIAQSAVMLQKAS